MTMQTLTESYWPADTSAPLLELTVGGLLTAQAAKTPDAVAIIGTAYGTSEARRLTYAELLGEARAIASTILGYAAPGDFVAMWAPNVIEWPIVEYAAGLAGVTLVALNPVLRERELAYALDDSKARLLIYAETSRAYDMKSVLESARPDRAYLEHVISLADLAGLPADSELPDLRSISPDAPAMLQYTSGTTGDPKGVLLRHRSLVNNAKMTMDVTEAEPGAMCLNPLPMFHTASCIISTLGPVCLGGGVVLVEQFIPDVVLDLMRDEKVSVLFFVPTVLGALIEAQRASDKPAPRLRTIMGGAATVPSVMIEAANELFGATVHNLFGQTELAPVLTAIRRTDSLQDQLTTVGRPIPQVECKITDPATGETMPLGDVGEICARGPQQMLEYYGKPDATAAAIDADGWLHMGDLGTMGERGFVTVTGRLKDMIIRGGENIAPAEVESILVRHPEVLEAVVLGLPDEKWGETVAAVIRPRGEPRADLRASLEAHCRASLSPYKVPSTWYVSDELPMTPTGKVQKFRLREVIDGGTLVALDRD
ncbi:fatty-acyl-CoA synthase/long-chain acyl-CoA synthetase [Antricoccus suffuscus]|uniref:Fatty-acyl-CoA synthase/long-chain acyl-CoA synthetase n=1 Tax=Antricoccus suffuscus TaxID=1629062 RepID=A0A2T0ZYA5_9ACTN|nr:class I adenylate-forming enzyme family protein [Antricoccus suffuscus]PRZ41068.1 fatty-acyl-CoA synthase/long-chain acyl-CoA synthetase [Antricoccus suffuscus]